jgi:uncharacterized protein with PIN domain
MEQAQEDDRVEQEAERTCLSCASLTGQLAALQERHNRVLSQHHDLDRLVDSLSTQLQEAEAQLTALTQARAIEPRE